MAEAPLSAPKRLAVAVNRAVRLDRAARALSRRRLLVVCYHGLRRDDDPTRHWLLLPEGEFARQVRYLARHYRCLPIDDAFAALRDGTLREPTACVTFDDGYRSNHDIGLPVLRACGVPATIYLPTALIGTGDVIWTTHVELLLAATPAASVDLSGLGLGVQPLGDGAARAALGRRVVEALKLAPNVERRAWLERLAALGEVPAERLAPFATMDWEAVAAMGRSGLVTFGGHTVHHGILSRYSDAEVADEVGASVAEVARRTSAVSRTFAYPNGRPVDFDARAADAARRAGAAAAVSTIEGLNTRDTDPYALRRLVIGGELGFDTFRLRVTALSLRRA